MRARTHLPLLLVAILIIYGSLWPFEFVRPGSHELALRDMLATSSWWTSTGDVAGNVLLFVPLGIAIVIAARGLANARLAQSIYFALAVFFAFAVQVLQIYTPSRAPSLTDVLWNAVGTLIGLVAAHTLMRSVPRLARAHDPYAFVAVLVVVFWAGAVLWPFVPTIDFQQIKDSVKPLLLQGRFSAASFTRYTVDIVLIAATVAAFRHSHRALVVLVCAALASKPFLVGQTITLAFFIAAIAGTAIGLAMQRVGLARSSGLIVAVALAWFAIDALRPFEFSATRRPFQWIPFAAMLRGAMDINLASLCHAAFFSGALMLIGARLNWQLGVLAILLSVWFFGFEFAQQWIPTRTGDITIALLPIAWWIGLRLVPLRKL